MTSMVKSLWTVCSGSGSVGFYETEEKANQNAETRATAAPGTEFYVGLVKRTVKATPSKPTLNYFEHAEV